MENFLFHLKKIVFFFHKGGKILEEVDQGGYGTSVLGGVQDYIGHSCQQPAVIKTALS